MGVGGRKGKGKGYALAVLAGLNAAFAAIAAKFFSNYIIRYGLVVLCNVTMWGCYVNSLKALSSLQATVTNFATNFISSGLAGSLLFQESLPIQVNHMILIALECSLMYCVSWFP
ncbi:hypothetical protein LINGRAHAP2_LOCUS4165 [Linum grandiflorum]